LLLNGSKICLVVSKNGLLRNGARRRLWSQIMGLLAMAKRLLWSRKWPWPRQQDLLLWHRERAGWPIWQQDGNVLFAENGSGWTGGKASSGCSQTACWPGHWQDRLAVVQRTGLLAAQDVGCGPKTGLLAIARRRLVQKTACWYQGRTPVVVQRTDLLQRRHSKMSVGGPKTGLFRERQDGGSKMLRERAWLHRQQRRHCQVRERVCRQRQQDAWVQRMAWLASRQQDVLCGPENGPVNGSKTLGCNPENGLVGHDSKISSMVQRMGLAGYGSKTGWLRGQRTALAQRTGSKDCLCAQRNGFVHGGQIIGNKNGPITATVVVQRMGFAGHDSKIHVVVHKNGPVEPWQDRLSGQKRPIGHGSKERHCVRERALLAAAARRLVVVQRTGLLAAVARRFVSRERALLAMAADVYCVQRNGLVGRS
jgi:hypothetical protein